MRQVDADDFGQAGKLPLFDEDRMFAKSKITPTAIESVVAEIIGRHQGRANPISIAMLCKATGKDERTIKGVVAELVTTHRARIGGYRGSGSGSGHQAWGYAVIVDAEDLAAAVGPYRAQILAMWRRLRVLMEKHALAELRGQLTLEEQGDEEGEGSVQGKGGARETDSGAGGNGGRSVPGERGDIAV